MNKSKIEKRQAGTTADSSTQVDVTTSSQTIGKPLVVCCAISVFKKFVKWIKELPYNTCPNCNKKGVSFSHEEHFTAGSPSVYVCKFCNEYFI